MNVSTQMNLAREFGELWGALFPDFGTPNRDQLLLWAGTHPQARVVHGINRTAKKARKLRDTACPMSLTDAVRYASSVMKNEKCGFRRFPHGEQQYLRNISGERSNGQ